MLAPQRTVDEPGLRVLHRLVTTYGTPHAVAFFRCLTDLALLVLQSSYDPPVLLECSM